MLRIEQQLLLENEIGLRIGLTRITEKTGVDWKSKDGRKRKVLRNVSVERGETSQGWVPLAMYMDCYVLEGTG